MNKYTFKELIRDVLTNALRPLTPLEIWKEAEKQGFAQKLNSQGETPDRTIGARIYTDLKENPESIYMRVGKNPTKFCLKNKENFVDNSSKSVNSEESKCEKQKNNYCELDLHILLSTFVRTNTNFKCYTKTICHNKSSKPQEKGQNEWTHPDIVGIYFPYESYDGTTIKLQEGLVDSSYKLFSFEMKQKLDRGNLRECYFQAVSNSSWANEGYLVALVIAEDSDFMDELRRLNNAFGIGIIKLNAENITQSEILFSAKAKEFLDWATINRLIIMNPDFKSFIDGLTEDIQVKKVKSKYDQIFETDRDNAAFKYAKEKRMI